MKTVFELEAVKGEEERISRYFSATPEERQQMRETYAAQVAGELATAKVAFESEE